MVYISIRSHDDPPVFPPPPGGTPLNRWRMMIDTITSSPAALMASSLPCLALIVFVLWTPGNNQTSVRLWLHIVRFTGPHFNLNATKYVFCSVRLLCSLLPSRITTAKADIELARPFRLCALLVDIFLRPTQALLQQHH